MRKIYDEYLHVPEQGEGKVREQVFFARLTLSVICMAICMFAMAYNAYAYFVSNIESNANVLQASTYTLEVDVQSALAGKGSVAAEPGVQNKYTLQPGTYNFKLTKPDTATATTGYCRIDVDEVLQDGVVTYRSSFYTQQIGNIANSETPIKERTITISVNKATVVQFVPCWGTYAGAEENAETYLTDGMAIQIKDEVIAKVDTSTLANVSVVSEGDSNNNEQQTNPQPSEQSVQPAVTTVPESNNEKAEEGSQDIQPKEDSDNTGDSAGGEQTSTETQPTE